jgi:periplasmic protein CpxP/Spy
MSKIKLLLVINFCVIGFLFLRKPFPAPNGPHSFRPIEPKSRIIEILHFDHEQVAKYEKLIEQHRTSIKLLNYRIRETKSNLYETLREENAAVKDSLILELGYLQKEIETVHYNHFKEIKSLCKPDQSEYFTKLTFELGDFFGGGRSPHD